MREDRSGPGQGAGTETHPNRHEGSTQTVESPGISRGLISTLTSWVTSNPGTALGIVLLLTAVSAGITARFLTFKTDRADLIHSGAEFHQRWLNYVDRFGDQSEVLVVVEGTNREAIQAALDSVGSKLEAHPEAFDRVMYRFDPSILKSKGLQYLAPRDLNAIMEQLTRQSSILEGDWGQAGIEAHAQRLSHAWNQLNQAQPAESESGNREATLSRTNATPGLVSQGEMESLEEATLLFCRSLNQFQQTPGGFESPWPSAVSPGMQAGLEQFVPQYQINAEGTMGFVLASPLAASQDFSGASQALDLLRKIVREYDDLHPEVSIGLTGIPVLESDEMLRSQQDMSWASLISFLGVGIVMLVGFRGLRHPFMSLITLIVGIVGCLGYTTIVVGHLNILSVSFAAILIGLGIDFAIHYLARYLELRHLGVPLEPALLQTSTGVGTGIITAAVTTALAFFCASFTSFLGVAELGVIAGGGILICAMATFVVLPALVTFSDRKVNPQRLPTPFEGNLVRYLTRQYPGTVALVTLAAILAIGCQGFELRNQRFRSRVRYDSNLLHLQAKDIASVDLQHRVFEKSQGSLLFAVSLTDSPDEVRRLKSEFLSLPSVGRVEELASYLPTYPPSETQLLVQGIHARLSRLSDLPGQFPQLDPDAIGKSLERLYIELQKRPEPTARLATTELDTYLERLTQLELTDQIVLLRGYQQAMLTALHRQFEAIAAASDPTLVSPDDFEYPIRSRFLSSHGDWLIRVYPREQVWDEAPLEQFVRDVRQVDPEITGTPLQNYEAARQIRQSYLNASTYALGVIILTLLIDAMSGAPLVLSLVSPLIVVGFTLFTLDGAFELHHSWFITMYVSVAVLVAAIFDFKSVRNTLLALGPPLLGLFLTFGILGLAGIDLNPANMIVLPLILGIGVDDGVHVIHDYRQQRGRYQTAPSTINAITLTSLTSMIGFGSMIVAAHQGLVSLGIVLVVGVGSCLFISLVTLPAVLTLIGTDHPSKDAVTAHPSTTEGFEIDSGQDSDAENDDKTHQNVLPISFGRQTNRRDAAS